MKLQDPEKVTARCEDAVLCAPYFRSDNLNIRCRLPRHSMERSGADIEERDGRWQFRGGGVRLL